MPQTRDNYNSTSGMSVDWGEWSEWEEKVWNPKQGKYQNRRQRENTGYQQGEDYASRFPGVGRFQHEFQDWVADIVEQLPEEGIPQLHMPSFAFHMPEQPDYGAMFQEAQDKADKAQGIRDMNQYYEQRSGAANDAIAFIEADEGSRKSRAALMGVDYSITDDEKATKINDYFASIWSDANELRLNELMTEWGDPAGFTGFAIQRGEATAAEPKEGSILTEAFSGGVRPGGGGGANRLLESIGTGGIGSGQEDEYELLSV